MTDGAEKFRNIPAIRGRLADPMKTSREMEEIFDNLKNPPDNSEITQEIANLKISNNDLSEIVSNSIINSQRDLEDISYNLENLEGTYEEIGRQMQEAMYDQLVELQRLRKQEDMKIKLQKKRIEIMKNSSEHLENIDEGIEETNENLRIANENLEDMQNTLSNEFQKTQEYLSDMKQSSERMGAVTYGTNIPQKKSVSTLMENADFSGKLTLLALHAKGMLTDDAEDGTNTLRRTFSPSFIEYVKKKSNPQKVREICERKKARIQIRTEEYKNFEREYERLDKEYQELESERDNIDEKGYQERSDKLGNKRKEKQEAIENMQKTKDSIVKEKIGLLSDEEMDLFDMYHVAKTADNILDLINMGMVDDATLEKLLRNQSIDGETSLQIARIMEISEAGVKPKIGLDGIVGINQKSEALMIQGNIALQQRRSIIKNLDGIGKYLQKNDEGIEKANKNLENINQEIERSNMFLDGILQNSEMTNDLIEESNYLLAEGNELLEEGNELTRISNHILAEIHSQIEKTGNQLTEVLENIGNAIIIGFNETLEKLDDIQMISEHIAEINEEMLQELYKQSEILSSIDKKLSTPLEIKANEYFRYGMEMLNTGKHPTKEDRKTALESFENGLKYKNTHTLNLYGAGTALKNLKEDKRATMYMERAYKLANKEGNATLSNNIAMDLAKTYTKYLKLKVAKYRIDEAIMHDKDDIEAFLLRARLSNILNQKEEFRKTLNILYHKIVEEGKHTTLKGDYQDVLEYLFKPAKDHIDAYMQKGVLARLLKTLPGLQSIGHKEATKTIVENTLFQYPQDLIRSDIDIKSIISENKEQFNTLYQTYVHREFKGGQSQNFFVLAYLGYGNIDFEILDTLITTGLDFDIDYIKLKNSTVQAERKQYQTNIQKKIYALGEDAKYLLRDYLKRHPNSILSA